MIRSPLITKRAFLFTGGHRYWSGDDHKWVSTGCLCIEMDSCYVILGELCGAIAQHPRERDLNRINKAACYQRYPSVLIRFDICVYLWIKIALLFRRAFSNSNLNLINTILYEDGCVGFVRSVDEGCHTDRFDPIQQLFLVNAHQVH